MKRDLILIKTNNYSVYRYYDYLILVRSDLEELAGKISNKEDPNSSNDLKVKIPKRYKTNKGSNLLSSELTGSGNDIINSLNLETENNSLYILIEDTVGYFILRWIGNQLGKDQIENLEDNVKAIIYDYVDNIDNLTKILNDPTKDWFNLYMYV